MRQSRVWFVQKVPETGCFTSDLGPREDSCSGCILVSQRTRKEKTIHPNEELRSMMLQTKDCIRRNYHVSEGLKCTSTRYLTIHSFRIPELETFDKLERFASHWVGIFVLHSIFVFPVVGTPWTTFPPQSKSKFYSWHNRRKPGSEIQSVRLHEQSLLYFQFPPPLWAKIYFCIYCLYLINSKYYLYLYSLSVFIVCI